MRSALVVAGLVLLAGCTETYRWSKADVSEEQRKEDIASCRAVAEKKAAEQFSHDLTRIEEPIGGIGGPQALRRDFARADARQYRNKIYENCLINMGYRKYLRDPK